MNHTSVFKDRLHNISSALSQFPGLCRYFPRWGQSSFKASRIIRSRNASPLHKLIHCPHKHATSEHLIQHTTIQHWGGDYLKTCCRKTWETKSFWVTTLRTSLQKRFHNLPQLLHSKKILHKHLPLTIFRCHFFCRFWTKIKCIQSRKAVDQWWSLAVGAHSNM